MTNRYEEESKVKQMICEIGRRVFERGYVAANDGNISVRMSDDIIFVHQQELAKDT